MLILLFSLGFTAQIKKDFHIPPNPKVGLSLSGGGAKGFAHVGALKVIDSLGIKIDYVAGTSMGAIVGGLYAAGYSGKEIEKVVMETDFYSIIANEKNRQDTPFFNKSVEKYLLTVPVKKGKINLVPKAISTGQKNLYLLKDLFSRVEGVEDFSKLPIPFMCIATNLETGALKIFEHGNLVNSIMASSAFPSLMDPVKIADSLYIDGAVTVNYPSKQLKDKGIDIVIGVDLNQGLSTRKDLQSAVSILNQVIDFGIQKETEIQYKFTDINIKPNLEGISAISYDNKKTVLDSGFAASLKYAETLKLLPKKLSTLRVPGSYIFSNVYKIDSFALINSNIFGENYVLGKMNLKIPSRQTYGSINKKIDKLYATNNYTLINYDLVHERGANLLKVIVEEDSTRLFLKLGLHYDEIFKTGLLLNITAKRLLLRNSILSIDMVIGDKPRYYVNYFVDNGYIPGLGIHASGSILDIKTHGGATEKWNWMRNEAFLQSIWRDRFAVGGGISHDYLEIKPSSQNTFAHSSNFINPYFFIKSDTRDEKDFPSKGLYLAAEGKFINLFSTAKPKIFQTKTTAQFNFPANNWLTNRLRLAGGLTFGEPNLYYQYHAGGLFEQNLGNFFQFASYQFGELTCENLAIVANDVQFRLSKNIFATAHMDVLNSFEDSHSKDVLSIKASSLGVTFGYRSPVGQVKLDYSRSLNQERDAFNIILGHWF